MMFSKEFDKIDDTIMTAIKSDSFSYGIYLAVKQEISK